MATLPEIQSYIITNATGFQTPSSTGSAVPIYLGAMPADKPDRAVALYESGGLAPAQTLGSSAVSFENPSIQVLNRALAYTDARSDARRIFRVLNGVVGKTLTGKTYLNITPIQQPFDLPRDVGDRQRFSCNYNISKEES